MSHILTKNSIGNIHMTYLKSLKRTCQLNKQIYKLLISHSCFQLMDARLMIRVTLSVIALPFVRCVLFRCVSPWRVIQQKFIFASTLFSLLYGQTHSSEGKKKHTHFKELSPT